MEQLPTTYKDAGRYAHMDESGRPCLEHAVEGNAWSNCRDGRIEGCHQLQLQKPGNNGAILAAFEMRRRDPGLTPLP